LAWSRQEQQWGRNFAATFAGFGQRQMDKIKRDLGDMREKNRDELEYGVGGCDLDSFIHFSFLHSSFTFRATLFFLGFSFYFVWVHFCAWIL
jgi:hypothetical protein